MKPSNIFQLILLAAIWGSSFIFMRILAPVLGPLVTADMRLLLAGVTLTLFFGITRYSLDWKAHWKKYLIIGVVNSAIPFSLFSFAALHIPASYSAIINASSPLFGALCAAIWLGDPLTFKKIVGLILGAMGVGLVVKVPQAEFTPEFAASAAACLLAALCYGLSGTYIKKYCSGVRSKAIAGASQLLGALALLPFVLANILANGVRTDIVLTPFLISNMLALSLLCSAIAYLFYYHLISEVGPTRALTVTFLVPVFGMLWSTLFLHETITLKMCVGTGLIIAGTVLVLGLRLGRRVNPSSLILEPSPLRGIKS